MKRSKNISLAKKKADKYFSEYIRLRDWKRNCATCGFHVTSYWNYDGKLVINGDAGHFIHRGNSNTRYDEKNVALQCMKCNRFESGRQYEFSKYIDSRWGEGTADKLLMKSKMASSKMVQFDYEVIAEEFKKKAADLRKDLDKNKKITNLKER